MKIILFNTLYHPNIVGGAEKSVQSLAENLIKKGNKVIVISTSDNSYQDELNGVKVYYISTKNIYWGFNNEQKQLFKKIVWHTIDSYNIRIKKILQQILLLEKPDIVHTNNLSGFSVIVWNIAKKLNCNIVHTLRDYYLLCPKATMFKNGKNCESQCFSCNKFSIPKKNNSDLVDAVVGISQFILEKHIKYGYFKNSRINTVIGNDVGEISKKDKKINPKKIVFGFIGQITKIKGIEFLLNTFQNLNNINNWKLIIAGKGDINYTSYLKSKYKNKKIEFIGSVNPNKYYPTIDCLIVPSLWEEPFGRVVLEGINHGKCVLGSNRGGINELLAPQNIFDPNTDALKKMILKILTSGEVPKETTPTLNNITDKYIALYRNISLQKTKEC